MILASVRKFAKAQRRKNKLALIKPVVLHGRRFLMRQVMRERHYASVAADRKTGVNLKDGSFVSIENRWVRKALHAARKLQPHQRVQQ